VRDVQRSEVWGFRWREPRDAAAALERVVHGTNLIQNPNKHRVEIAAGEERLHPRGNVWVLVSTPGAGAELAETLARHRLAAGEIPRTGRGVLWELDLDAEGAARLRLADEIAVVRSHRTGLLANPHLEDAAVFAAPPTAAELAARLVPEGAPGGLVR
jgi:hypothetical protein